MPEQNNEMFQEELILAEANIVRAKRHERSVLTELQGLTVEEIMGERTEMDLAHEEKILAQEAYVLKRRQMQEAPPKVVVVESADELFGVLQALAQALGEGVEAPEDLTCPDLEYFDQEVQKGFMMQEIFEALDDADKQISCMTQAALESAAQMKEELCAVREILAKSMK